VEAAHVAAKTQQTSLAAQYQRIAARRGKKRALIALGHTIRVIVHTLLTRQQPIRIWARLTLTLWRNNGSSAGSYDAWSVWGTGCLYSRMWRDALLGLLFSAEYQFWRGLCTGGAPLVPAHGLIPALLKTSVDEVLKGRTALRLAE
jgi:hypothetical protein